MPTSPDSDVPAISTSPGPSTSALPTSAPSTPAALPDTRKRPRDSLPTRPVKKGRHENMLGFARVLYYKTEQDYGDNVAPHRTTNDDVPLIYWTKTFECSIIAPELTSYRYEKAKANFSDEKTALATMLVQSNISKDVEEQLRLLGDCIEVEGKNLFQNRTKIQRLKDWPKMYRISITDAVTNQTKRYLRQRVDFPLEDERLGVGVDLRELKNMRFMYLLMRQRDRPQTYTLVLNEFYDDDTLQWYSKHGTLYNDRDVVVCAGVMIVFKDTFVYMDNCSGTFAPSRDHLETARNVLNYGRGDDPVFYSFDKDWLNEDRFDFRAYVSDPNVPVHPDVQPRNRFRLR